MCLGTKQILALLDATGPDDFDFILFKYRYVQPTAIGCAVYLTSVVANKEGRVPNSLEIKPIFLKQSLSSSFNLDKLILLNANRE